MKGEKNMFKEKETEEIINLINQVEKETIISNKNFNVNVNENGLIMSVNKEENHKIKFKINDNIKKLKQILDLIDEEEREFTVERLMRMLEIVKDIKFIEEFTKGFISIKIDNKTI